MALLFVTQVTFFRRVAASSKPCRKIRSMPFRLCTAVCIATSSGVPSRRIPPQRKYSPSLFSRSTMRSTGAVDRSGVRTPAKLRAGRTLAKRSKA